MIKNTEIQSLKVMNVLGQVVLNKEKVVSDKIASEIIKGVDEDSLVDSLNWLSQTNNHFVTLADPDYPKALLEIADPPPVLYAKGNLALLN